jgi:hypothetical protein
MEKSKCYQLYVALDKEEKAAFKKWIYSPIANQHNDVTAVFEFLFSKKYLNANIVQKEKIFEYLYPNKKYNDLRFRHVIANCTKCLESFLSYFQFQKDENTTSLYLLKSLEKHQHNKYANTLLSHQKQAIKNNKIKDSSNILSAIEIEKIDFNIHGQNIRDKAFNIQYISDLLHQYAQTEILKFACLAITHQQISNSTYTFPLLNTILKYTAENFDNVTFPNKIYYLIYLSLTEKENDDTIYLLKEFLVDAKNKFQHNELRDIYLLTINQCIKKINSGKKDFAFVAYNLFQLLISENLLLQNNELDRFAFTNIVFTGLIVKDFLGVEKFIHKNAIFLAQEYRENIVAIALARLYYTQKLYNKSINVILQANFEDFLMSLSARLLLTKIYVETKDFDVAENHIQSFKKYLHRQKNIGYHKDSILKFLMMCIKLIAVINATKREKNNFQKAITNDEKLIEKEWLLEQLN